ncbi:MAG: hypothetical protein Q9202_001194 [Teloschistes flavicans]
MSLIGVIVLTAGYEFVREMSRRYEALSTEYANKLPNCLDEDDDEDVRERSSLLWATGKSLGEVEKRQKLVKAAFYAIQVFYSFFIM